VGSGPAHFFKPRRATPKKGKLIGMRIDVLDGSDGSNAAGPQGIVGWISQTRAAVPDLHFAIEVGPIIQDDRLALRWNAAGHYGGGFPGATAPVGTPIAFTGTDLLRAQDGLLAEYWVNSDIHVLLAQLQITPPG